MLSYVQYNAQKNRLENCLNKAVEKLGRNDIKKIKEEAVRLYNTSYKAQPLDFLTREDVFKKYFN